MRLNPDYSRDLKFLVQYTSLDEIWNWNEIIINDVSFICTAPNTPPPNLVLKTFFCYYGFGLIPYASQNRPHPLDLRNDAYLVGFAESDHLSDRTRYVPAWLCLYH
ncbi:hypothetical protein FF2_023207 [Malus domestica]